MSTQEVATILNNNFLVHIPTGYFRSKLFATNSTSNLLLAAASPLLSVLERLSVSPTLPDIREARESIQHELFAFNSRLDTEIYNQEYIMLAHYLLYATIDELLGKNYLRLFGHNVDFKAFTPLYGDEVAPEEMFFKIVTILKEHPARYLDLIELAYYCLIGGFEGKYHGQAQGRQDLDNLIDELHDLIAANRVHKQHKLFNEAPAPETKNRSNKPFMLISALLIGVIATGYFSTNKLLEHQAKTILYKSNQYAVTDN